VGDGQADHPLVADRADLDHRPVAHRRHDRADAGEREVEGGDREIGHGKVAAQR